MIYYYYFIVVSWVFLLFYTLVMAGNICAQNTPEMRAELHKLIRSDTTLANNKSETQQLYNQLLQAHAKSDSLNIAEALHRISTDYSSSGRWKRGEELALQALQIARNIQIDSTVASSLNALAIALTSKINNLYQNGEINDEKFLQLADSVIFIYNQKLDVLERLNLPIYKAYTYQGMGQIYLRTKQLRPQDVQIASEYFKKAISTAQTTNDQLLQFMTQIWYGISLSHQEKYNEISTLLDELVVLPFNSLSIFCHRSS